MKISRVIIIDKLTVKCAFSRNGSDSAFDAECTTFLSRDCFEADAKRNDPAVLSAMRKIHSFARNDKGD